MGLTSRKKRPLDRAIPHLRDTRLIIIATEGEKTEYQYFTSGIFNHHRVQIHVLRTDAGESAPRHVLNRLKEYVRETVLQYDDQLWLMVDMDRWTVAHLGDVCMKAKKGCRHDINLAVSSPCFELWHTCTMQTGQVGQYPAQVWRLP